MKHLFGLLAIVCLLAAGTIMLNLGLLPKSDKLFISLLFGGISLISIHCYIDARSWEYCSRASWEKRNTSLRGSLVLFLVSTGMVLLSIFIL